MVNRRVITRVVLPVLAGLALTSCTATNDVVGNADESTTSSPASDMNSFEYALVGGGTIDLTRGPTAEPVALWFWAPG